MEYGSSVRKILRTCKIWMAEASIKDQTSNDYVNGINLATLTLRIPPSAGSPDLSFSAQYQDTLGTVYS